MTHGRSRVKKNTRRNRKRPIERGQKGCDRKRKSTKRIKRRQITNRRGRRPKGNWKRKFKKLTRTKRKQKKTGEG